MSINQFLSNLSFEFFPSKTVGDGASLLKTAQALAAFNPRFVSVTYGALNSSTERSDDTITLLQENTSLPVAAHVTTCNLSKTAALAWVEELYQRGVRHIVALRGDSSAKPTLEHYHNAAEFISALRTQFPDIEISAAAYPERHKEAISLQAELDYVKHKLDCGADNLITQFYLDPIVIETYYNQLQQLGIEKALIAGILPVTNFSRTASMAQFCKVSIPQALAERYQALGSDSKAQTQLAIETGIELVKATAEVGIQDFHFYCMNKAPVVKAIIEELWQK